MAERTEPEGEEARGKKARQRYRRTVTINIEPRLMRELRSEADGLGMDVPSYICWCIETGLFLRDLNVLINNMRAEPPSDDASQDKEP